MERQHLSVLACFFSILFSVIFLARSLDAKATDRTITYTQIQRDAGISIFGTQIPYNVTYDNVETSGVFTLTSWTYDKCQSINVDTNTVCNSVSQADDYVWLFYSTTAFSGQHYGDFVIDLPVHFSDSARGIFGMSFTGLTSTVSSTSNDNNITSYPGTYFNNIRGICQNTQVSQSLSDYYGYMRLDFFDNGTADYWTYRPIMYDFTGGQDISTIYFEHMRTSSNGQIGFVIGLPYVYGSVSAGSSVTTSTSSGGQSDSGTDMTETNGLLGQIKNILNGIVDGIKNLFIPSDEALEDFSDDMDELIQDHLGGLYEALDLINGVWDQFNSVTAKTEIYIPACEVPLAGSTLTLGNWHVPLKPTGMPAVLYESLAWIIDFLAVASFLRMCRNKLEIFLNPNSEVITSDN